MLRLCNHATVTKAMLAICGRLLGILTRAKEFGEHALEYSTSHNSSFFKDVTFDGSLMMEGSMSDRDSRSTQGS